MDLLSMNVLTLALLWVYRESQQDRECKGYGLLPNQEAWIKIKTSAVIYTFRCRCTLYYSELNMWLALRLAFVSQLSPWKLRAL